MMLTPEEARIHAHVCGDGYLTIYIERHALRVVRGRRYYRPRVRYVVGYSNNEPALIQEFVSDVRKTYNVSCRVLVRNGHYEARLKSKRVFSRLRELGAGPSRGWRIGEDILQSHADVKKAWLRAFFDDEASVLPHEGRIRVKSMNKHGLEQVSHLLAGLGIASRITGQNKDGSWYLVLSGTHARRYVAEVGFLHPEKSLKARELLRRCKNAVYLTTSPG